MIRVCIVCVIGTLACAREAAPCESTTPVEVRSPSPALTGAYAAGDRVWIRFGEHWYPGRVVSEIAPGVYEVGYESYDPDWNRVARPDQLRAYDQPPPSQDLHDAPPSAFPEAGHPVDDVRRLQPGDRVLVLWNEVWWPAVVVSIQGDQAEVRYDGYGAEHDELVGTDRLTTPRE